MTTLEPATADAYADELRELATVLDQGADRARRRGLAALAGALAHAAAESRFCADTEDSFNPRQIGLL